MPQTAFPRQTDDVETAGDPRVVASDEAGAVLDALAANTARRILAAVSDEPMPPAELAKAVETSLQNVTYHLDALHEAGVVEIVDTWYSSRGCEMDVYGPVSDPLVISFGDDQADSAVRALLDV